MEKSKELEMKNVVDNDLKTKTQARLQILEEMDKLEAQLNQQRLELSQTSDQLAEYKKAFTKLTTQISNLKFSHQG